MDSQAAGDPQISEADRERKQLRRSALFRGRGIRHVMNAARSTRELARMDPVEASDLPLGDLPSDEQWATAHDNLRNGNADPGLVEAATNLRHVSERLVVATQIWAVFLQVPAAEGDARDAFAEYRSARSAALSATEAAFEQLNTRIPKEQAKYWRWLKEHLADPATWTVFFTVGGALSYGLLRLIDLAIYAPFGVSPEELGRTSLATIPYAITLLILLGVALIIGAIVGALVAALLLTLGSGRRRLVAWRTKQPIAEPNQDTDIALTRIWIAIGCLGLVGAAVLGLIADSRNNIRACRASDSLAFAVGGWQSSLVSGFEPSLPAFESSHQLAYLGSGSSHAVIWDCTSEESLRVPHSVTITLQSGRDIGD